MIDYEKLVPEVYVNESRDFQLLARLRTILFNYLKNNTEVLANRYEDSSKLLLSLLATTLGIDSRYEFSNEELKALSSVYMDIIKNKGSIYALKLATNLLPKLNGSSEQIEILVEEGGVLELWLPSDVLNINLVENVVNMIMPAGTKYHIYRNALIATDLVTEFNNSDSYVKSIHNEDKMKETYSGITKLIDGKIDDNNSLDSNGEIGTPGEIKTSIDNAYLPRRLENEEE